jgi:hypothetical protein
MPDPDHQQRRLELIQVLLIRISAADQAGAVNVGAADMIECPVDHPTLHLLVRTRLCRRATNRHPLRSVPSESFMHPRPGDHHNTRRQERHDGVVVVRCSGGCMRSICISRLGMARHMQLLQLARRVRPSQAADRRSLKRRCKVFVDKRFTATPVYCTAAPCPLPTPSGQAVRASPLVLPKHPTPSGFWKGPHKLFDSLGWRVPTVAPQACHLHPQEDKTK